MSFVRITGDEKIDHGLDEIVAENVDVHLERMDNGIFWMSIRSAEDKREVHVWLSSKRTIKGSTEDQGWHERGAVSAPE